jgi:3-oxoacyl-[acyl-carrier protein] reductase
MNWLKREIPLGCCGSPDDIGSAATFLLSPIAKFMTGAIWQVDGGHTR